MKKRKKIKISKKVPNYNQPLPSFEENTTSPQVKKAASAFDNLGKNKWPFFIASGIFSVGLLLFVGWLLVRTFSTPNTQVPAETTTITSALEKDPSENLLADQEQEEGYYLFKTQEGIADFLAQYDFEELDIDEIVYQCKKKGIEFFKAGQVIQLDRYDELDQPIHFLYDLSPTETLAIDMEKAEVEIIAKTLNTRLKIAGGIVKTELWKAVLDNDIHYEILEKMEKALKWTVDFYHVEPGDEFKVAYEEYVEEGTVTGTGQLLAIQFKTAGNTIKVYLVKDGPKATYFDQFGRLAKKKFLKSPVKYGRISSAYNPNRIHPVLKEKRPHFGTDYAAPEGAPVYAVGNGKIEIAGRTKNNGNYIKIRHDQTFQTQYLHLQSFAKGMKNGTAVKQGEIIGYVGQTGLATGPHVCFRFWKDGQQVNHIKEKVMELSVSTTLNEEAFLATKDSLNDLFGNFELRLK